MNPEVGSYYWVRFKAGAERAWQVGQVRSNNGLLWVARVYDRPNEDRVVLLPAFSPLQTL